jgi:hypothetical protein
LSIYPGPIAGALLIGVIGMGCFLLAGALPRGRVGTGFGIAVVVCTIVSAVLVFAPFILAEIFEKRI